MDTVRNNGLDPNLYLKEEKFKVSDGTEQNLSQEDFFALLTEQLSNQDPTKPVDNDQLVAQMTSFTTADGVNKLNEQFESFSASMTSNQALQASSLIGQDVLVAGDTAYMGAAGEGISGVVVNESTAQNMQITIENKFGEIIKVIDAGTQAAGNVEFNWDGTDQRGNPMPPGDYRVKAQGEVFGEGVAIPTAINRHVGSVSLAGSNQGVILNLAGNVSIRLDDVIQIGS
ncbi:flagellar hook assembly protein FlgD [Alteromonas oceanisediminis]|uniref:flagellar hook assembly protein FlgD n=1 Tax=Alteromonas oceanisediminis TaxID=2836180 RepID=UPI001BD979B4|nr:flagellar hook assembly protein FlgD [Alteromonas oceanisediminis]MBT0584966.1 flagellar hook assembly protein FlgD [Alteromonas oceanisediminis]